MSSLITTTAIGLIEPWPSRPRTRCARRIPTGAALEPRRDRLGGVIHGITVSRRDGMCAPFTLAWGVAAENARASGSLRRCDRSEDRQTGSERLLDLP